MSELRGPPGDDGKLGSDAATAAVLGGNVYAISQARERRESVAPITPEEIMMLRQLVQAGPALLHMLGMATSLRHKCPTFRRVADAEESE